MTSSTPVLLLDIDGVINSLLRDPPAQVEGFLAKLEEVRGAVSGS